MSGATRSSACVIKDIYGGLRRGIHGLSDASLDLSTQPQNASLTVYPRTHTHTSAQTPQSKQRQVRVYTTPASPTRPPHHETYTPQQRHKQFILVISFDFDRLYGIPRALHPRHSSPIYRTYTAPRSSSSHTRSRQGNEAARTTSAFLVVLLLAPSNNDIVDLWNVLATDWQGYRIPTPRSARVTNEKL